MQDINLYYESIKQVYSQISDQLANYSKRKQPLRKRLANWFVGISTTLFFTSLIPILPLVIIFLGSQFNWVVGPLSLKQVSLGQIVVVWISLTIPSLLIFVIALWINHKVGTIEDKHMEPTQTLSPEQLTFISVYEAYKELKIYFVSHIDKHIENSRLALARISPSIQRRIAFQEVQGPQHLDFIEAYIVNEGVHRLERTSLSMQISVAQEFLKTFEQYPWLQIEQSTKLILSALISFPDKVFGRLEKREELPSVLNILENLSKFLYAYLPEHKTYMDPAALEKLQSAGEQCLKIFVQEVNSMTYYSPPTEQKPTKTERSLSWLDKVRKSGFFGILLRFTIWFILLLVFTTVAVYLLSQRFTLSSDTVVTLIIGSSIAGATVLTSILPKTSIKFK